MNDTTTKKFDTGVSYKNSKYRPSIFIDKDKQIQIEQRYKSLGFKTANEYINYLINNDISQIGKK